MVISRLIIVRIVLPLLVAVSVTLNGGCVYYNTFYNGEKAFNSAEKARKASGQANMNDYQTAIAKALKIIDNYPKSKYYDDALFVLAVSYYHTNQYDKSERRFRELLTNYPKSKYCKEASVYLAQAKLQLRETAEAMAAFEEIFQTDYEKQYKAQAALQLGEYYANEKQYDRSIGYYRSVRDSLGDQVQQRKAQIAIAEAYSLNYQFADALSAFLQVLGLKPAKSEEYHALYSAADCAYKVVRVNDGLAYLKRLADNPFFFDSLGAIQLKMAEGHELEGEMTLAQGLYGDIAATTNNRAWMAKAYYRLGLIAQFDYDNLDEAKVYYDKAVESGRMTGQMSDDVNDALQRSADIGKIALYQRQKTGKQAKIKQVKPNTTIAALLTDTSKASTKSDLTHTGDSAKMSTASVDTTRKADSVGAIASADSTHHKDSVGMIATVDSTRKTDSVRTTASLDSTRKADTLNTIAGADSTRKVDSVGTTAFGDSTRKADSLSATASLDSTRKADTINSIAGVDSTRKTDSLGAPVRTADSVRVTDTSKTIAAGADSVGVKAKAESTGPKNTMTGQVGADTTMGNADSVTQAEINDAASQQYALAELFWYQLDKPDTAIVIMQNLLDSMSTSRIAPKAMLALSEMIKEQRADTAAADSILKAIPHRFPHSDYLPEILGVLGLRGTPADTGYAEVYIRKAENFWTDEKNYDSARYWYQYVVDHFPQSAHYDRARFALIWLTENFQSPGDSSVFRAYQEFADSFPQSPFATDARNKLVVTTPVKHQDEDIGPPSPEDSTVLAQNQPPDTMVALSNDSTGGSPAYFNPEQQVYYRGNDTLVLLQDPPVRVEIPFEFPQEAYNIDKDRFYIYFQVLLDFTGKVKDFKLYSPSGNAEIDRRASQAMQTSTFNTMKIRPEYLDKWQVYKMLIEKPTELR